MINLDKIRDKTANNLWKFEDLWTNVLIQNEWVHHSSGLDLLFGSDAKIQVLPVTTTIIDVLVLAGVFVSKSQARKGVVGDFSIPDGFTTWEDLGKKHLCLAVFKPIELMSMTNWFRAVDLGIVSGGVVEFESWCLVHENELVGNEVKVEMIWRNLTDDELKLVFNF